MSSFRSARDDFDSPHAEKFAIISAINRNPAIGQVLIRNLNDEVISSLRYRAKLKGRPLEQELREILTNAAHFTREERVRIAEALQAGLPAEDFDIRAAIRFSRDDEFEYHAAG